MKQYIPKKGDFIVLTLDSQIGHEQQGKRPALVISNDLFNKRAGLAIVCPITTIDKNFPFHVPILQNPKVTGFVMIDQVKAIDYVARNAKYIGRASEELLGNVLKILEVCLY